MKPKIYIFAMHLAYGGVEKAVCAMANLFIELGYPVKIICTYNMPNSPAYPLSQNVEVEYLLKDIPNRKEFMDSLHSFNPFKILYEGCRSVKILYQKKSRIKKRIKQISDGIIITTRHEDSLVLSKYGNDQVYKIAQLHHDHEFKEEYVSGFKNGYQRIDCFALLTDQLKNEVQEMLWSAGNHHTVCVTVPNFVDNFSVEPLHVSKEKHCISVGRLHPVKGFDRLIEAFVKIHEQMSDYDLMIVGDGDEISRLQKMILDLNANEYIHLLGAKNADEVARLMQSASLYLMSSYSEGLPFVLIEAQSACLPIVAYDVRVGPRAVVHDGQDGYLVQDGDIDEFVLKSCEILKDDSLRLAMGNQAYENGKQFCKDSVASIWKKVLEKGYDE